MLQEMVRVRVRVINQSNKSAGNKSRVYAIPGGMYLTSREETAGVLPDLLAVVGSICSPILSQPIVSQY